MDQSTALTDVNIVVPTVNELSNCETSEAMEALEMPPEDGFVGFAGLDKIKCRKMLQITQTI